MLRAKQGAYSHRHKSSSAWKKNHKKLVNLTLNLFPTIIQQRRPERMASRVALAALEQAQHTPPVSELL